MRIAAIINGDDFGLAPAINAGIHEAHANGCLTSASLSVAGPAAEEAAHISAALPNLGVGLHLTLVSERPVSPPSEIPTLVNADGRLFPGPFSFTRRWMAGRMRAKDVRIEIRAQLKRANDLGLQLTHLDGEDHMHILPGIIEIVLDEMKRVGLMRLRIPFDSEKAVKGHWSRKILRVGLNWAAKRAATLARGEGFVFTEHFMGFLSAGRASQERLLAILQSLKPGVTEISLHPGKGAKAPREDLISWGYDWEVELKALTDSKVLDVIKKKEIETLNYSQLPSRLRKR